MISKQEITDMAKLVVTNGDILQDVVYILEGIQNYIFNRQPTSKFMQLCGDENWTYATGIADHINKQVITQTTLFQDFVKKVKTSPDYVSKIREDQLNKIFEK